MAMSIAERKQIENEMIFRRLNEKLGFDLDALDAMHIEDGNPHLIHDDLLLLEFKCECSDENCTVRIPLKLSVYRSVHVNRSAYLIKPGHQVDQIEKVFVEEKDYSVVLKYNTTPEPSDELNKTTIDNSKN